MQIEKRLNISVLCNSDIALPALKELMLCANLIAIGIHRKGNNVYVIEHFAKENKIPLKYFEKSSFSKEIHEWANTYNSDSVFAITFPFRIPETVLSIPHKGLFNFHFGLLPAYRSTDPIFWQIKNGEKFGGISVHKMDKDLDTGPVLLLKKIPIAIDTSHGKHWNDLAALGAAIIPSVIKLVYSNDYNLLDQANGKYWGKPVYADVKINWKENSAKQVIALVKACNPWNKGAFAFLNNNEIRIVDAKLTEYKDNLGVKPGRIVVDNNKILIQCADAEFIEPTIFYTSEGFFTSDYLIQQGVNAYSLFS